MEEVNGLKFHLTRHAVRRYQQRVGIYQSDHDIIKHCLDGLGDFEPVWESHRNKEGLVLVSVVPKNRSRKVYF